MYFSYQYSIGEARRFFDEVSAIACLAIKRTG
ncbi:hypothetical protein O176_00340 [Chlamydia trachomatis]|nr:hypothetical protein E150_00330 [Chlamydia trachomatis E/150]ADH20519.1 hypothetical protein E11023_00325 [Chlamydia trachomatis E/11023]AGT64843.1 hypothetical protein O169_00340 [Chlamydia trachomatis]AGT67628.1 hypothetical protein O173_00340 [Chlamydia trachomatis F/11-96]AGT65773.1 hypothetical protein O170_00340 [Chlamydia trachomatis]